MTSRRDPAAYPSHAPVEKMLSGDFGSPLELMASNDLKPDHKRQILEVWLRDLEAHPDSPHKRSLRDAIWDALGSLEAAARGRN